jgi:hypothetical protein
MRKGDKKRKDWVKIGLDKVKRFRRDEKATMPNKHFSRLAYNLCYHRVKTTC